jgi:hypothetical protein
MTDETRGHVGERRRGHPALSYNDQMTRPPGARRESAFGRCSGAWSTAIATSRHRLPRAVIAQDPPVVLASSHRVDQRVTPCAADERAPRFSAEGERLCDDPGAERAEA